MKLLVTCKVNECLGVHNPLTFIVRQSEEVMWVSSALQCARQGNVVLKNWRHSTSFKCNSFWAHQHTMETKLGPVNLAKAAMTILFICGDLDFNSIFYMMYIYMEAQRELAPKLISTHSASDLSCRALKPVKQLVSGGCSETLPVSCRVLLWATWHSLFSLIHSHHTICSNRDSKQFWGLYQDCVTQWRADFTDY